MHGQQKKKISRIIATHFFYFDILFVAHYQHNGRPVLLKCSWKCVGYPPLEPKDDTKPADRWRSNVETLHADIL